MKRIFGLLTALVMVFVLASTPALAAPVVTSAFRSVEVGIFDSYDEFGPIFNSYDSTSFGLGIFNGAVDEMLDDGEGPERVIASQNSVISGPTGEFSGTGLVDMGFSLLQAADPYADSFFDVFFTLPTASAYTLTGLLDANADGGIIASRFFLNGPTPLFYEIVDSGSVVIGSTGTLASGPYELKVYSSILANGLGYMGGQGSYEFNLQIIDTTTTPVPEPTSMLLFGTGIAIAGLVGTRLRRKK